ncbi:MAG: SDR family NAD(P)-dependent oxidoreductase [Rhodospirillaceae bacterium]
MNDLFSLGGRVGLVTGSAQGIGAVLVDGLCRAGASMAIVDLQEERGMAFEAEIKARGGKALFIKADVTSEAAMAAAIAKTAEHFGGFDILVNNARPLDRNRHDFPDNLAGWDMEQDVLLAAPARTIKAALPYLKASGRGVVVNLASVVGYTVSHTSLGYHVAKAGVMQLTRYLAHRLGPNGIRVNAICPGIVDRDTGTKFTDDPRAKAVLDRIVPLRRTGSGKDIANAAVFLCSDAGSYITGQTLVVDGGLTLPLSFDAGVEGFEAGVQSVRGS